MTDLEALARECAEGHGGACGGEDGPVCDYDEEGLAKEILALARRVQDEAARKARREALLDCIDEVAAYKCGAAESMDAASDHRYAAAAELERRLRALLSEGEVTHGQS